METKKSKIICLDQEQEDTPRVKAYFLNRDIQKVTLINFKLQNK